MLAGRSMAELICEMIMAQGRRGNMTETSTLLKYDIVDLDASVQKELLESISKEGIVIYEKI